VRKRLWPIVVLLLAALVAVPLLVGASSSAPAPPGGGVMAAVPPQPAPGPAVQEAATTLPRERAARVRDPFFDPPAEPSDDAGTPKQSAGPSAAASPKATAEKPAANPSEATSADAKPSSPVARKPAAPAPAEGPTARTGTYHRTAARLAIGATTRPLARLTPIGDAAQPAAMYLGVLKVGRPYALFVLGHRTTSAGDATCVAETACRIIGLRPGDTQTVTVHTADGRTVHRYVVHVSSVTRITTSAAKARALRAAVHPDGWAAARAMSGDAAVAAALRSVGYRRSTGLLFSQAAEALAQATG